MTDLAVCFFGLAARLPLAEALLPPLLGLPALTTTPLSICKTGS